MPGARAKRPGRQGVHSVPSAEDSEPAGQTPHACCDHSAVAVPPAHGRQLCAPRTAEKRPGAQF